MILQGFVLPTLSLLSYLKPDGTHYANPWLKQPLPASLLPTSSDSNPSQASQQASQDPEPASQAAAPTPPAPEQLLAAASARLSQHSTAELASATSAQDGTSANAAPRQAQGPAAPEQQLESHRGQDFQEALVQSAAALVAKSPLPNSRCQAMVWLNSLVPDLTDRGCQDIAKSDAVVAAVRVIQQDSELPETRVAALELCLRLQDRGVLPVAALLGAGVQQHLTKLVLQSGQSHCPGPRVAIAKPKLRNHMFRRNCQMYTRRDETVERSCEHTVRVSHCSGKRVSEERRPWTAGYRNIKSGQPLLWYTDNTAWLFMQ